MDKFKPTLTFEIKNSKGLFEKLLEEYADFDKKHMNPRFAMNCAINSWHLSDWTFQEFFKNDERFQDSEKEEKNRIVKISGLLKYQQYLNKLCPELEYMRLITNGIKHCILNDKNRTEKTKIHIGDFDDNDFCRHDWDVTRFIIEINDKEEIDFEETLLTTIEFWRNFIENPR